ncbi:carbohydrate kinase family protein [Patescibacteria group bacterium]|nr:carbohydrate kinase family protein [Patescibacteria group bacterium]MBU1895536.1 carbohydrate kinase family protein [Patescibacteria group bacterium]
MFDLITIGDSTIDTFLIIDDAHLGCGLRKEEKLLCLRYADKIPIVHSDQSVGGNAANVAVGAHKLGLQTAIVSELGDDINGHAIKHALSEAGVNTKFVHLLKKEETRYSVVLNYHGERTILSYQAKRNYTFPKLTQSKWIYYTSLTKSFEKIQKKLSTYLIKHSKIKMAMNPGSYQLKHGLNQIRLLLPQTEIMFVNKEEADKIVGKKKNIKKTCQAFLQKGVKTIVITDSIKGSFAGHDKDIYFMPIYPLKAKAKTGAGDAYTSGFLSAIIKDKPIAEAMQWGTANAAGVIQKIGAQKGLLTKTTLEKLIKKYSKIKPYKIK